ncbi:AAA family ATPase, partial [uncultured Selenomonas sp.]|uniref:AAA family ATPase n=1 Tax=uncultured Selenomonas sp. TaxID=159275 RepID=UPI0028DB9551
MRPLRLTMEAFGSYGKKTVIDFTELGERSFFLIHGRTGSGKTTLLDAICFAFYGEVSMAGRTGTMMRTDEAPRETKTSVDLVFVLGAKKYHIWRAPSYERPKKDGSALTSVQASAMLWQVEDGEKGEERVLAQRPLTVTQKMTELLGFGPVEFRQVVLLPQGAFRDLLTAKVDEREKLLAILFKTERYRRLEELLKVRAKAMEERRKEIKTLEEALLAGGKEESLAAHIAASEEKEKSLAALEKRAEELKGKHEAAQSEEQKGLRAAELLTRLETARKDRAEHEKKRGAVERYRAQLKEAQRAAQIEDVAALAARDREKAKEREDERRAAEKRHEKAARERKTAEDALAHEKAREDELEAGKAKTRKLEEYSV